MANLLKIRDICREKKIPLKELAQKIGISQNGLQRILNDNTTKIETLEKIAEVLQVPIEVFFYEKPIENSEKVKELEKELESIHKVADSLHIKITIYRQFMSLVEKNLHLFIGEGIVMTHEKEETAKNIKVYMDFLHSYDDSYFYSDPSSVEKMVNEWINSKIVSAYTHK